MSLMQMIPELELSVDFLIVNDIDNNIAYKTGLYFIYNSDKVVVYVGKSGNLKDRLRSHFTGNTHTKKHYENFRYFKYHLFNDLTELDIYETYYIDKFQPIYNRDKKYKQRAKVKAKTEAEIIERLPKTERYIAFVELYKSIGERMNNNYKQNFIHKTRINTSKDKRKLDELQKQFPNEYEEYKRDLFDSM